MRLKKLLGCVFALSLLAETNTLFAQGGMGGFGGPTVLGRSQQTGQRGGQSARLRAFGSANYVYDSGLTTINSGGVTRPAASNGIEVLTGAYGGSQTRRGQFGLEYRGDYRYYTGLSAWNGTDQSLALSGTHQATKRLGLEGQALVGTTNRAFSGVAGLTPTGVGDPMLLSQGLGFNSLFDVRTDFGTASGGLVYNVSPRLSASVFGSGFTVRRRNRALIGMDGALGRADIAYRVGRMTTVAVDLQYFKFDFRNTFGDTTAYDAGIFVGHRVGRRWEIGLRAGMLRFDVNATRSVPLEPEIARLLGVGSTVEIFYRRQYLPSFSGLARWAGRRSNFSAQLQNGIGPGNGIVFTTRQTNIMGSYGYNATKRSNLSFSANYSRLTSATNIAGTFNQYALGVGYNRKLTGSLEFLARFDRRQASFSGNNRPLNINGNRIMIGLAFAPGELPLSIW